MNKRKLAFSILALLMVFTNCSVDNKDFIDKIDTSKSVNEIETNDIISFYIENEPALFAIARTAKPNVWTSPNK